MRRKCKWRENDFTRPSNSDEGWQVGWCLLITGGMMSAPTAVVEAEDGTLHNVEIYNVVLEQDGGAE